MQASTQSKSLGICVRRLPHYLRKMHKSFDRLVAFASTPLQDDSGREDSSSQTWTSSLTLMAKCQVLIALCLKATNSQTAQHPPRHEQSGHLDEQPMNQKGLSLVHDFVVTGGATSRGIMLSVSAVTMRGAYCVAAFAMVRSHASATDVAVFMFNLVGGPDHRLPCMQVREQSW